MKQGLLLLAFSGLLACSADEPSPTTQLAGTWRLTNYCKPNGSGGCTLTAIPTDKTVSITFTSDKQFRESYGNNRYEGYGFIGCPGTYEPEGDGIRLFTICSSSSHGILIRIVSVGERELRLANGTIGDYVLVR